MLINSFDFIIELVIESSYGPKNNFTEVHMNAIKVIPENLVASCLLTLRNSPLYKLMEGPITALQKLDCDWFLHNFIEVNFSKLTNSNQMFRNDFVRIHYNLCKISS